ncbi:MAG TPA: nuclear transport factor 2 family protein [Planctomycetaceae bacterium]|jgi:hypothetical protein|nr:nuclear transport factor 2 family protein [Planctomycetaceae bacterium]
METEFTPEERRLVELWERHMRYEFADRDAAKTVDTMSDENYVNHVPVMTGGRGRDEMLEFYGRYFISQMPADTRITSVCRTVGQERVIDEIIFSFTHDIEMNWMLPGVPPTGGTSTFQPWLSCSSAGTQSFVKGFTGIRRRCSSRSACSTRRSCPS